MWIPIDTRLADHPRVHQIALASELPQDYVVGILARLWGLLADLQTEVLPGDVETLRTCYRLPNGFLEAVVEVGWAELRAGEVRFATRNAERDAAREARREIARQGGLAKAAAAGTCKQPASSCKQPASSLQAGCFPATDRQKRRKKETETAAVSSPPPALEGAGGEPTFSAAQALRAGLAIGKPPGEPRADPVAALKALQGATG